MTTSQFRSRKVARLVTAVEPEGREAFLQQALPTPELEAADPFLLVQEVGPRVIDTILATAPIPHRGFSLLTYVADGALEQHAEGQSLGVVPSGGASLVTLGAGAVLSETISMGPVHAFRLWVNSPASQKGLPLNSQVAGEKDLPMFTIPGMESRVRVIAGECFGQKSALNFPNTMLFDFEISPGEELVQHVPEGWNVIVYVSRNTGLFGEDGDPVSQRELAAFTMTGEGVRFANGSLAAPLRFIFAASVPIAEPMVRYGAFVMNSDAEIQRAFEDFKNR